MSSIPIAVFARAPIPGRCKTRLAATIGAERAAALSAAFVVDTLRTVRAIDRLAPELHVADSPEHPFFAAMCARFALPAPSLQREGELGARMCSALDRGAPSLIVGSDAPTIAPSILLEAIVALEEGGADLVLSPAADGGYVLIGSAGRAPPAFLVSPGARWSTAHALADTVRGARRAALRVALTSPAYDVDDAPDLALLTLQLALDPEAAPETAAVLRGEARPSPF
ncbi:MAG: TIGR04282 family arsenosugar biosynthesis glycosyltransferase [Myxococcota bacterium]|nr:TIGR04282 family arsenosugar biosynthesis glycosyltransferase [Myxococcota bacterium]